MIILKETTDKLREMFPISGTNKLRKDIMTDFEMSEFHPSPKTIDRSLRWLINNEYLKKGKRGEFVRI